MKRFTQGMTLEPGESASLVFEYKVIASGDEERRKWKLQKEKFRKWIEFLCFWRRIK